jgi:hypothetical protein
MKSKSASAEERAYNAAQLTLEGRALSQKHKGLNALVAATNDIMADEPVFMSTSVFFVAIALDISVSYEMYRQVATANAARWESVLTPCMAAIVVLWAALSAFYMGKKLKTPLRELEQMRLETTGLCAELAIENTQKRTENQFNIGLLSTTVLFATVVWMSYYRTQLLGDADQGEYSWFDTFMPVLFINLEIYCGFYVGYAWVRIVRYVKIEMYASAFQKCASNCVQETKMAVIFHEEALKEKEVFTPSKHLQDAIFRWKNLSTEDDTYFDSIP